MLAQHFSDRGRIAGEDVEHALGHAGLFRQRHQRQRGERGFIGGFEHHGAAGGERGRHFSGDHRAGEIPRRDGAADADRLLDREQPRIRPLRRDGLAVDAAGFLGKELDIGAADIDFAERFRQRLALLGGQDQRKVLAVGDDEIEPLSQNVGALLGRELCPGRECALGGFHRLRGFRGAHDRDFRELDAVDGIGDGPRRRADPGAVDVAAVFQERGILQPVVQRGGGSLGAGGSGRGHGVAPRIFLGIDPSIGRKPATIHRPPGGGRFNDI